MTQPKFMVPGAGFNSNLATTTIDSYEDHHFMIDRMRNNLNTYSINRNRICQLNFNTSEWIHKNFESYSMVSESEWIAYKQMSKEGNPVRVYGYNERNSLRYTVAGDRDAVMAFDSWMSTQGFRDREIEISWAFGPDYTKMELFNVPLETLPPLKFAYPWVPQGVDQFTKTFMESRESILILMGPPGTGKTNFIKNMIKFTGRNAMVTYDTNLLFSDGFFAAFMSDRNCNVLILEDADNIMGARKDGNSMMHRFLNASDGLISMRDKKIVFTTNLPKVSDIDPALIRPGRCHDILTFRNLDQAECRSVLKELGRDNSISLPKPNYSLAEITNMSNKVLEKIKPSVGFVR